ncbi:sensor histidine kinase [Jiangella alba]|uniref:histidine kinase n=1 Tax=Jiangella alba TaxID=561176 RepID=A0A1H5PW45_9ACTN|nr:histidine kinase [Jiangella alba]SEF18082.1 Signal transduction histidine kinase [Jiangella alba]
MADHLGDGRSPGRPRPVVALPLHPIDADGLLERLRLTAVATGIAALGVPAWILLVLAIVAVPLSVVGIGLWIAVIVVHGTAVLVNVLRTIAEGLLDADLPEHTADGGGRSPLRLVAAWLRDPLRWRELALTGFAATGGLLLSAFPAGLLLSLPAHGTLLLTDGGPVWAALTVLAVPMTVLWWVGTPWLVRTRALADAAILGHSLSRRLAERVVEVEKTRAELIDHSAAEVRRIERDLHDGAQARIAAVGMNVGLAERLLKADPEAAAELLREAREGTVSALEDLRSVVRGIHPPALADRGLTGAVEALALSLPGPVTVTLRLPGPLPAPVESALYFAVAECLANAVKHAGATRLWVTGGVDGHRVRLVVGDDGRGGADPRGSGLSGVARRLAAFDSTVAVASPVGGPTTVTLEVPWPGSEP